MISPLFNDKFEPRKCQRELLDAVRARIGEGQRVTVAWFSPGGGKTLSYQAVANDLFRSGDIYTLAVYAPRTSLAEQCELDYTNDGVHLFDSAARIEKILHNINEPPFTPGPRLGFVSTYAALTTQPNLHLDWARKNQGRFLLVVDEAQFCGIEDADRAVAGTAAGNMIMMLHEYAAHTLILTGTPYRSDKAQIVLATYREEPDTGKKYIDYHAKASYADGIEQKYLRPFESRCIDASVARRNIELGTSETSALSEDSRQLRDILRREEIWQPIVDQTVVELKDAQEQWHKYKALIACMEKEEARKVASYLEARYPNLKVAVALSDGGTQAQRVLRAFRTDNTDILVTVRMAFVGYDCKRITVIGCLTNYRDWGHLEQLIGRGLRVDKDSGIEPDQQKCRIIAPDDGRMQAFLDFLRREQDRGITPPGQGQDQPQQVEFVESATATTTRIVALDADLDPPKVAKIEKIKRETGISGSISSVAKFLDQHHPGWFEASGFTTEESAPQQPPMTDRERVKLIKSRVKDEINRAVGKVIDYLYGESQSSSEFERRVPVLRNKINQRFGVKSASEVTTVEDAERYLQLAVSMSASYCAEHGA